MTGQAAAPKVVKGNPNPKNYTVLKYSNYNGHLTLMVEYPDANNYEGKKILVYRDTSILAIANTNELDPHFCDDEHLSPFARFEPTDEGWNSALKLMEQM